VLVEPLKFVEEDEETTEEEAKNMKRENENTSTIRMSMKRKVKGGRITRRSRYMRKRR
jgi:hypothetical protein